MVSEVRVKLPDLESPPALEPEQARFRLFDSITTLLKSAARSQPLMLVLDDLHWADRSSLLLLEFLAGEIQSSPLLVLGTYRDVEVSRRHPLSETLGSLIRGERFLRVQLPGLAEGEVNQLIQRAVAVSPPSGLSATIHQRTEGNPLFVTEVVRLLVQEGELTQESGTGDSWTVRIPEGVREVIGRRLNRLSQGCNETLTIASVVGREFELRQLTPLVEDISEDRLLDVLDEALGARVIEELSQAVGRYQFTHALIQDTLTAELTLTRRARLHARIGEVLEELYGTEAEAHAGELAYHFGEAETVLGPEKLVHYSMLAGERALAAYAWEEALGSFERGLVAKGVALAGSDPAGDADSAELLFGLGRAQLATLISHQMPEAVSSLSRAFDYYVDGEDVANAVAIAEIPLLGPAGVAAQSAQMVPRALALVPADSHEAGLLLSLQGCELGRVQRDYAGAQEAFDRALAISIREGDAGLQLRTLTNACYVDTFHMRWKEGLERGLKAIELGGQVDDLASTNMARHYTARMLLDTGNLREARVHATASLDLAERLRDRVALVTALWNNGNVSLAMGDWQAAREFSDRGLALSPEEHRLLPSRVMLEYQVGDFSQGTVFLDRLLELLRDNTGRLSPIGQGVRHRTAIAILLVARITGRGDNLGICESAAEAYLSQQRMMGNPLDDRTATASLGLIAVLRGDVGSARNHYPTLRSAQGTALGTVSTAAVAADRLLGLLAHTMGNLDLAAEHFEEALVFCRKGGYRPDLAWTCCDYADTVMQRNEPGDREKAMTLLDESLSISSELVMRPFLEMVMSRLEKLKA